MSKPILDDYTRRRVMIVNRERDEARAEVKRLQEALRECVRLSGADLSDGFPTWPELPDFAVQEVKKLRNLYYEVLDECSILSPVLDVDIHKD